MVLPITTLDFQVTACMRGVGSKATACTVAHAWLRLKQQNLLFGEAF